MPPQFFVPKDITDYGSTDPYGNPQATTTPIKTQPSTLDDVFKNLPDQSKPTNLDDVFKNLPDQTQPKKEPSFFGSALDNFNKYVKDTIGDEPLLDLNPLAEQGAQAMEKMNPKVSQFMIDAAPFGIGNMVKDIMGSNYDPNKVWAEGTRKLGGLATDFTRPYNAALLALTEGSSAAKDLGLEALAKLGTWGVRAGSAPILGEGVRQDVNLATGDTPPTFGNIAGAAANTLFGGLGTMAPMPRGHLAGPEPVVKAAPEAPPPFQRNSFPGFTEPTQQPMLPGTEGTHYNFDFPPAQPHLETAPIDTGEVQQHLPYSALSWANVPEPRANAEGQYNLFQGNDAASSMEGVPRQSPFQFGPTPTMADFAPPGAPPTEPPAVAPPNAPPTAPPTAQGDIPGVIFQGDHAILAPASDANQMALTQRGYVPTGKLQNGWPVWHLKEDLSETAFTRSMRASIAKQTGQSAPMPEGMPPGGPTPIGADQPITLPKALATQGKLLELAERGYEIDKVLPSGDVVLAPTGKGTTMMSDPFGFGTVIQAGKNLVNKLKGEPGVEEDPLGGRYSLDEAMHYPQPPRDTTPEPPNELDKGLQSVIAYADHPRTLDAVDKVAQIGINNAPHNLNARMYFDDILARSAKKRAQLEASAAPDVPTNPARGPNQMYTGRGGTEVRSDPFGVGAMMDLMRNRSTPREQPPEEAQRMRVPGVQTGNTPGLENVAMGGATPRVLDVLGSSLYSRSRPVTVIKELLQNLFDEHKEHSITEPGRVLMDSYGKIPGTAEEARQITVRDRGKGLSPDEMYTVLTNLGETGKAGVESASGGFGFAKAAPFLGGKYARVISVVDTPRGRMRYSFEGDPIQLKDQAQGVGMNSEKVTNDIPTGMEISTWYDKNEPGWYDAKQFAKKMAEGSPSSPHGILFNDSMMSSDKAKQAWLDESPTNPIHPAFSSITTGVTTHKPGPMPTYQDTITTPGSEIKIHYDINPNKEIGVADLHMLNKGMYQGTDEIGYGGPTKNVPSSIIADIKATVEEGKPGYPFSANREQLDSGVRRAINKWVDDNIVSGVQKKKIAGLQAAYDGITNFPNTSVDFLDAGDKFTPNEVHAISNNFAFQKAVGAMKAVHGGVLAQADGLGWSPVNYSATWQLPSQRLKKFGLLFQEPHADGSVTLGIHIPRPDDVNNSAILINLPEHIKLAKSLDDLVTSVFTTIAHEAAHIPGGPHDQDFAYRDAQLRGKLGEGSTVNMFKVLRSAFDDGTGNINPELSKVLHVYDQSRLRAAGGNGDLIATGIGSKRPASAGLGKEKNPTGASTGGAEPQPTTRGKKPSVVREAYNFARGMTTTLDLSAPLRQGLPLMFTKAWRQSLGQMVQSLGSEAAFQKTLQDLNNRPLFQRQWDPAAGKLTKSFAEIAGMKLSDLHDISSREEAVVSNWAETGGMLGSDLPFVNKETGLQRGYQSTVGRATRASNRAYTAFLNQLRADSFESLLKDAYGDFKAGTKGAKDPYTDLTYAKEIADFVNTATGRGPLKLATPWITGGRLGEGGHVGMREFSGEQHAPLFADVMFSPRLMASRVRMLNPATYMMASPFVRKQYLKALFSVVGFAGTTAALAKGAGAEVSMDPNSSDFMKIKMGNTRLDMMGGFQQFGVAASRLITGHDTSSATGKDFETGQGYRTPTRLDIGQNFMANKLHPVAKFAYDLAHASQHQPFQVGDRTLQLFVPLIIGDVLDLAKEDPKLLPAVAPILFGAGSQTYDKGAPGSRFIPSSMDYNFTGGGLY